MLTPLGAGGGWGYLKNMNIYLSRFLYKRYQLLRGKKLNIWVKNEFHRKVGRKADKLCGTFARAARLFNRVKCDFNRFDAQFFNFLWKLRIRIVWKITKVYFRKLPWRKKCLMHYIYFGLEFWIWHAPRKREGGVGIKYNRIAEFCSELGSDNFWTRLNAIDHDFYRS